MAFAESTRNQEDALRKRIAELEQTVQNLQEKVNRMESTLTKGGGFMIVANYTCEISTPFDGNFSATELSEKAAKSSVIDQCKSKVADKNQCSDFFVKCHK